MVMGSRGHIAEMWEVGGKTWFRVESLQRTGYLGPGAK